MTAEEMFKKLGYDRHKDDFCGIKSLFYEKQNEFNDIIIIKFNGEYVNIHKNCNSSIWLSAKTIKAIDKQFDELKEESAEPRDSIQRKK